MEDLFLFTLTSYEMMCTFFTPDMHILYHLLIKHPFTDLLWMCYYHIRDGGEL